MLAELFIIIGLAVMMSVFISKFPLREDQSIVEQVSKVENKEDDMPQKPSPIQLVIRKCRQLVGSIGDTVQDLLAKFKRKKVTPSPYQGASLQRDSSLRGNTVFPGANRDVSGEKPVGHKDDFWSQEHKVETKPLIEKTLSNAFNEAEMFFAAKNFTKAEKLYIQAASEDPDNHKIFNRLGAIYMELKNYEDAIEAFRAAINLDQGIASRHYNLAVAYLAKGDKLRAKKCLMLAVELEPANAKYRKLLEDWA